MTAAGVVLINPKFDHNVGNALRTVHCHEAQFLRWTGDRVKNYLRGVRGRERLPREERLREYRAFDIQHAPNGDWLLPPGGWTPVVVEVRPNSESLFDFVHPERAVYIFGPEDGSVPKGVLHHAHKFVRIPSVTCFNLAATVAMVLYDRRCKERGIGRGLTELRG